MIHLAQVQGHVFMLCCTFELELSKRYFSFHDMHVHLNLLFLCCFHIPVALLFSSFSPCVNWALDYVLSRVGVVTGSTITGASADHFNVIISSGLRKSPIKDSL